MAFRLMALGRCSRGTSVGASDCRARAVERADGAADRREHVNRPGMAQPAEGQQRERAGGDGHAGLRDEHHAASIPRVGERAAAMEKKMIGIERDEPDHARARARARCGGTSSDTCHSSAAVCMFDAGERDELPRPEQAEVAVLKRDEGRLR